MGLKTCLLAIVTAVLASCGPASAQVRDIALAIGDKGEQLVRAYGLFNRQTCQTLAANITLQTVPSKGELRIAEAKRTFPANHEYCAGKPMVDTALHYTPKSGATGYDRIRLLETGGPNGPVEHELIIYIRDPAKLNTAPPTRADIDHIFGPVASLAALLEKQRQNPSSPAVSSQRPPASQPAPPAAAQPASSTQQPAGLIFMLPRHDSGVFQTKIQISGIETTGIIDTGATFVAISHSLALKLGIQNMSQLVQVPVKTANGDAMAKVTLLKSVDLGPFTEREVMAVILPEGVETPALIGMTFLSRFKTVRVNDRMLVMER